MKVQIFLAWLSLWHLLDSISVMKNPQKYFFCESLKEICTRGDIFSTVNDFLNRSNVLWKNYVSVTTDGLAALTGIKKGFQGKVTEVDCTTHEIRSLCHS